MVQVVLRLHKHYFADDNTLKCIASHLMLEQFGAEFDDAVFEHVRAAPCVCACLAEPVQRSTDRRPLHLSGYLLAPRKDAIHSGACRSTRTVVCFSWRGSRLPTNRFVSPLQVWVTQFDMPTQKRDANGNIITVKVSLRDIVRRIYNTARAGLNKSIKDTFRHEAGAHHCPLRVSVAGIQTFYS